MSLPGCAAIPAPYRERGADRLRDRPARGRDRARGPEAVRHPHARGVRERHRRQFGDRRLDQRADPHQRHRAPHRREAHDRGLGEDRLRRAAAGQHAAGRQISRRGILPRRRPAGGDERAAQGRAHPRRRADRQRQDHGRERQARQGRRRRRHPALRQAAEEAGRLHGAEGQPVRFRDHEDERDLRRIPQALSCRTRRTRMPSKAAPWCSTGRRTITTASTIRR